MTDPAPTSGFCPIHADNFLSLLDNFPPFLRAPAASFWMISLLRCRRTSTPGGLQRGQFYYGRDALARQLGLSPKTISTLEKRFEKLEEISRKSSNEGTTLTLLNFNSYVIDENKNGKQPANDWQTIGNKPNENKKKDTEEQRLRASLEASPHWDFISRLSHWFYVLPHIEPATESDMIHAQKEVELILRLDMKNEDDCEERLERLLQWAVQDEQNDRWPGWKSVTLSLAELRKKKSGVMKWKKIEAGMKTANLPPANGKPSALQVADEIMQKAARMEKEQGELLARRRREAGR